MSSIQKKSKQIRASLALGLSSFGMVGGALSVATVASADTAKVGAGDFDLTKQATSATFPVMFDRPSGINASAIAGAVRNLGSDSQIYKEAVAVVPEIADSSKVNALLSDSMSTDATTKATARATIVKLINWYNSLGGTQIKTQSGAAYTSDNLDQPINVLAVAFSNNKSINSKVSNTIDSAFANVKSVNDVMSIFDSYQSGTSSAYKSAFDAYAAKVYASGANIAELSSYSNVKPVLDAYEQMYANGGAAIRKQLLNGEASSTEAGVAFFESAVITGQVSNTDGGSSSTNTVTQKDVTTKWVDENGNELAKSETGKNYGDQKTFNGYTLKESKTENGTRTYVYTKNTTPTTPTKTSDTSWVDENGNKLKDTVSGEHPDNDGKSDIDGYTLVSTKTTTDSNGNTHVVNTYKKVTEQAKPDTYWFDTEGNSLKEKATGQSLPDTDGVSDIPGYKVTRVYTVTADDLKSDNGKNSGLKVGDVINIYTKETTPEAKKPTTKWVEEGTGKKLQDDKEGSFPDNDGKSDITGYTLVSTVTDTDGNVINTYTKTPEAPKTPKSTKTSWVDEKGKKLQDDKDGSHPDNDGKSDIPGYTLVSTKTDENGNVVNTYKKTPKTSWVDENGKKLQDDKEGQYPDNDGKSDIAGYTLVSTKTDDEGNVINTYKQNAAQVTTNWVDQDGKPLKDPVTGETFGEKDTFEGYTLVDVRKSDDGTKLYYVYAKNETPKQETPKQETPKQSELPKTGDVVGVAEAVAGTSALGAGAFVSGIAGKFGFKRRSKKSKK